MSKRTLPRNWPKNSPRGDYRAWCDSCGLPWPKSKMRRNQLHQLLCPDCNYPKNEWTIQQENINIRRRVRAAEEAIKEYERR